MVSIATLGLGLCECGEYVSAAGFELWLSPNPVTGRDRHPPRFPQAPRRIGAFRKPKPAVAANEELDASSKGLKRATRICVSVSRLRTVGCWTGLHAPVPFASQCGSLRKVLPPKSCKRNCRPDGGLGAVRTIYLQIAHCAARSIECLLTQLCLVKWRPRCARPHLLAFCVSRPRCFLRGGSRFSAFFGKSSRVGF